MTRTRQTDPAQDDHAVTMPDSLDGDVQQPKEPTLRWPACQTLELTEMAARQMAVAILSSQHSWQSLGGDALDGHHRDGKPLGIYLADRCHALAKEFTARLLELQGEHERELLAAQIAADAAQQTASA